MSKNKIKEIEQKYDMWADDFNLDPQDVEWLIEQAKRVEELESQVENWQKGRYLAVSTIDKERELKKRVQELEVWYHSYHKEAKLNNILKIQNKRYREAIEGIENAWKLTNDYQEYMNAIHDIIKDLEESK